MLTPEQSGFQTYALHFHAPFYALRKHKKVREDPRRRPNGTALRKSWAPSCLDPVSTRRWCLYELQTSIVVYGISNCVWTAYGIYDDYCNKQPSIETQYDKWNRSEGVKVLQDPLTKRPLLYVLIWDGRTYFLQAVRKQCERIKREWESIIRKMEEEARTK